MYNLNDHGDILEKTYSRFITEQFVSYQNVWKLYIGNVGNDTKASIPNYPIDRDKKRQAFSEHTYTILQSVILIKRLLDKRSFENIVDQDFDQKMDLQNNILIFFAHLGRIRDNSLAAGKCLLNINNTALDERFSEFYHQRHIPIHGRILPLVYKENGEIEMPVLSKNDEDPAGWNHKVNNWSDILSMPIKNLTETTTQLFWQLLPLLNEIFGNFEDVISAELNQGGFELEFKYGVNQAGFSGFSPKTAVNVYGIKSSGFGSSSLDGCHGSSGLHRPK